MTQKDIAPKQKKIDDLQKQFDAKYIELNEVHSLINKYKEVIDSKKQDYNLLRQNKQSISDEINSQEQGLNRVYQIN